MKICYLINSSSTLAERWLRHFARMEYEVHVVGFEFPREEIERVYYHILPANKKLLYFTLPFKLARFRRAVREIRPDIIDAHYVTKYGLIAAMIGFHPLVVTSPGSDILMQPKRNFIWKLVAIYALKKADLVVCRSSVAKEAIVKLGVAAGKINIVFPGVNPQEFQPMSKDESLKEELGIGPSNPVVTSTRSLSPIYDVETLVKAAPQILAEIPEAKFIIIGTGKQQDYLQDMARRLGISGSIKFVGWVPHHEIPRYLSSSDIYISTSLSDGTSSSLLEAMACELAPVVTDIAANRQWITDKENGFLVAVKDSRALAEKVIYLIKNKKTRESFGKTNRKIVLEKADQKMTMRELEEAYQNLLAGGIKNG